MKMYLQFGHGMMEHARVLLSSWSDSGVILSPRDLTESQMVRLAADIRERRAEPLLDPQCFARDADHPRLTEHRYWQVVKSQSTGAFTGGAGTAALLSELAQLGNSLGVSRHILPGCLAPTVGEDWFLMQESILDEASGHYGGAPLIMTIALGAEAMSSEEQIEAVVERCSGWDVSAIYLVAETPSPYLTDSPTWLANLLLLSSGIKLAGKEVIVGYSNHQMLCLGAANVDIVASGTWLNVRAFPPEKFYQTEDDSISRRATWYYCPQALSEYKIPFLDIAHRTGVLSQMRSPAAIGSHYADILFGGAVPTSVSWSETNAFRHYLTCLRSQVLAIKRGSFADTVSVINMSLDDAEALLRNLRRVGVMGQDRDFHEYVDVVRSAMVQFASAREARLSRAWG